MNGMLKRFDKRGTTEVRMHFARWDLDGEMLTDVTVFPHLCETCEGGDHTHVEICDTRPAIEAVGPVALSGAHKRLIDAALRAQLAVNRRTHDLFDAYVAPLC